MDDKLEAGGFFEFSLLNPDGTAAWTRQVKNGATDAGLAFLASLAFGSQTKISTWYFGVIGLSSFTGLAAGDTMASHSGWAEFTNYTTAAHQQWQTATSGNRVYTTTAATITITGGGTIHGLFLTSNATLGATTGTLWCTGLLDVDAAAGVGQQYRIAYTCLFAGS